MRKEYLAIFILFLILSFPNVANLCKIFYPFAFDTQVLTGWQYAASIGQIPYRDLFYPYGLLAFYKGHNSFFSLIYILLTPTLFTFFYYVFQKLSQNRIVALIAAGSLFLFVWLLTGFDVFTRYGTGAAYACLVGLLLFSAVYGYKKILFLGLLAGLLFGLMNDQGIYAAMVFVLLLGSSTGIRYGLTKGIQPYIALIPNIGVYVFGMVIGLLPFFLYLWTMNAFGSFISSLPELSDLQQLAKTPYFHAFVTPDLVFTLSLLFITIYSIAYALYSVQKPTRLLFVQISLVCFLLIVEQKSVMRHIDPALTSIGWVLFLLLVISWQKHVEKLFQKKFLFYLSFMFLCLFLIFFAGFQKAATEKGPYTCDNRFMIQEKAYTSVKTHLDSIPSFSGKVFSFPGDTLFYVLFQQLLPYYPTSFEASTKTAQEKLISYIKENNISFVIYNEKNTAIQDEVPNYIRNPYVLSYILTNFSIKKRVGDFLVFEKNSSHKDFFAKENIVKSPLLEKNLLDVTFEEIPFNEGLYKTQYLDAFKSLHFSSIKDINTYLQKHPITTKNAFLVLTFSPANKQQTTMVTMEIVEGYKTTVSFKTCGKTPCIIHLDRLPLFYTPRDIKKITFDHTSIPSRIDIVYLNKPKFW